ncbi:MAG: ComEC/Rec2 family competence protein [Alloprevotella sp.]
MLHLTVPLAVGIALADGLAACFCGFSPLWAWLAGLAGTAAACLQVRRGRPFLPWLWLSMASAGIALWQADVRALPPDADEPPGVHTALVVRTVRQTEARTDLEVLLRDAEGRRRTVYCRLRHVPQGESAGSGDAIVFYAPLQPPYDSGNPSSFDYRKYLHRRGVSGMAVCETGRWRKLSPEAAVGLWRAESIATRVQIRFLRLRRYLSGCLAACFEGDRLAILCAMTLGDRAAVPSGLRTLFSDSGTSHVLALSGLHLAILFGFFSLFRYLLPGRWGRWLFTLSTLAALWTFVLLTGAPVSLLRASVMVSVWQVGQMFRYGGSSLNNLALAALLILLFSPQALFDVGFQYTFLCVWTLTEVLPRWSLPEWVRCRPWVRRLVRLVLLTVTLQLVVAPLQAYTFHTVSLAGWVANLLVPPLAYLLLLFSVLYFLTPAAVQAFVATGLTAALDGLTGWLEWCNSLPLGTLVWLPAPGTVVALYAGLLLCVYGKPLGRPLRALGGMLCLLVALGAEVAARSSARVAPAVYFYSTRPQGVVHFVLSADSSYLWAPPGTPVDSACHYIRRDFWQEKRMAEPADIRCVPQTSPLAAELPLVAAGGRLFALVDSTTALPRSPLALRTDFLYVARSAGWQAGRVLAVFRPDTVVLDGAMSARCRALWLRELELRGIPCHDIHSQGALRVPLDAAAQR